MNLKKYSFFRHVFVSFAFGFCVFFCGCATTVRFNVIRPAELDLNGAKTIAVLPLKQPSQFYSVSRRDTKSLLFDFYDFLLGIERYDPELQRISDYVKNGIENGLYRAAYIKPVSSEATMEYLRGNRKENPADVYLVGEIIDYRVDDKRFETKKRLYQNPPEPKPSEPNPSHSPDSLKNPPPNPNFNPNQNPGSMPNPQFSPNRGPNAHSGMNPVPKTNPSANHSNPSYQKPAEPVRLAPNEFVRGDYIVSEEWERRVQFNIRYQVVSGSTDEIIAIKTEYVSGTSSRRDMPQELPPPFVIVENRLSYVVRDILQALQPYSETKTLSLLSYKDHAGMKYADSLADDGYFGSSYEAFYEIYKNEKIFEAGYNSVILLEAQGKFEEAEKLAEEIASSMPNEKIFSALSDIRYELNSAKRLEKQNEDRNAK